MLMFGYSGWKGQQNVRAVVDDYDKKIRYLKHGALKAAKK
jgi:hypothetical protein